VLSRRTALLRPLQKRGGAGGGGGGARLEGRPRRSGATRPTSPPLIRLSLSKLHPLRPITISHPAVRKMQCCSCRKPAPSPRIASSRSKPCDRRSGRPSRLTHARAPATGVPTSLPCDAKRHAHGASVQPAPGHSRPPARRPPAPRPPVAARHPGRRATARAPLARAAADARPVGSAKIRHGPPARMPPRASAGAAQRPRCSFVNVPHRVTCHPAGLTRIL